ncbi:hypothetical protein, partial [Nonomuraea guangzhouensis]
MSEAAPWRTAQARTAIDDRLAAPLGPPRALFCLALKVRLATDAGAFDPALSGRLGAEVRTSIAAAAASDPAGMREALHRFTALVSAGPVPA